jgi:hypothetical protein
MMDHPVWPRRAEEVISTQAAFDAMGLFVRAFIERGGSGSENDLLNLNAWITSLEDGGPMDPAMWMDWLAAVDAARVAKAAV